MKLKNFCEFLARYHVFGKLLKELSNLLKFHNRGKTKSSTEMKYFNTVKAGYFN